MQWGCWQRPVVRRTLSAGRWREDAGARHHLTTYSVVASLRMLLPFGTCRVGNLEAFPDLPRDMFRCRVHGQRASENEAVEGAEGKGVVGKLGLCI
jgi:hypothetical protein